MVLASTLYILLCEVLRGLGVCGDLYKTLYASLGLVIGYLVALQDWIMPCHKSLAYDARIKFL